MRWKFLERKLHTEAVFTSYLIRVRFRKELDDIYAALDYALDVLAKEELMAS